MPSQSLLPFIAFVALLGTILIVLAVRRAKLKKGEQQVDSDPQHLLELQERWRAPNELVSMPTPRPVAYTGQAKVAMVCGVVLVIGFAVMGTFMYRSLKEGQRRIELLQQNGVTAEAEIIRKWDRSSGRSRNYYAMYRFTAEDGTVHDQRASLSSSTYKRLREGERVPVRYLPVDPRISRLEIESGPGPVWLVAIPLGMFVLLAFALLFPIRSQKNLLQYGQATPGIVTRNTYVKGGRLINYRFLDSTNNPIDGRSTMAPKDAPEPGVTITVLYDPNNSKQNATYPLQMVRIKQN